MSAPRERFPDWLAARARSIPDHPALEAAGASWTFAELDSAATRMARSLAAQGAGAGGRVATLLHNGPVAAILPHTALRLGATLVPLNVRLGDAELAWQLGDAAPRVLVADERTIERARRVAEKVAGLGVVELDASASEKLLASPAVHDAADTSLRFEHDADAALAIIYTSGTTGRPKGALLTVRNFWWSAIGSALNLGSETDDRWLACLPLFHVGGLSILLRSAIFGTTAVVHDGFDPVAVNAAIDEDGVTIISVVAVMLQRMLDARDDRPWPATLRCVLLGGGPAPRALVERCGAARVPVVQTYGLTEACSQVATLSLAEAAEHVGSAGRALYPNALRIAEPADDTSSDGAGEILVRGPIVMAGYVGQPVATARTIVKGWLHTGDLGRLDADGFLYVLDRRDDLIVTGGENVYPAEVEAALLVHPTVIEAGVVGMPDDRWGARVVAVVRCDEGGTAVDAGALEAFVRERLAGYKVPREIRFVSDPLPRTASGKLRRGELRGVLTAAR